MGATQIVGRQIVDGAVDDVKIKAGAAIATSKLADGANFIKKDGSVAFTGNVDLGSQRIINVQTPAGVNDGVNRGYVDTIIGGLNSAYKYRVVRVASTANVNLSNPGTSIFDTVTLAVGDLMLQKNQTAAAENGIYVFNGPGAAMTRNADSDAWSEIPGSLVDVLEGAANGATRYKNINSSTGTLGTTAINYALDGSGALTAANFVDKETPSGSINGSNVTFTLANTPAAGSEYVFLNGLLLDVGAGNDYTISGAVITLSVAPLTGEKIKVGYRK